MPTIPDFRNKGNKENLTEHNSAVEANSSYEAPGKLFRGENQPLAIVLKMECHHHHTGNRTRIFHLSLRLVSRCFLAAPQSRRVRG